MKSITKHWREIFDPTVQIFLNSVVSSLFKFNEKVRIMAKVICNECEKEYEVYCSDLEWEVTSYEKHSEGMGNETHYNAEWEEVCKCKNNLEIKFFYVEYPSGCLETDETTTSGCSINGNCSPI